MVNLMRYIILLMTPIPYMYHSLFMVKGHHQIVNTEIRLIYSMQPRLVDLYTVSKNKT